MGAHNKKTSPTMQALHIPRLTRLIKENPGLPKTKIYKLRPFTFNIKTLETILNCARSQGKLMSTQSDRGKEALWYVTSNDLNEE